jgi:hypothetical protein
MLTRFLPRGRRRLAALVVVTIGLAAGGIAYAAFPDTNVDTYTGCLNVGGTSGGQISQVTTGLSPLKPCGSNQKLIHLSGGDITKVAAGAGLTATPSAGDNGAVTLAIDGSHSLPQTCSAGDFAKWDGTSWNCDKYTNSTGLDLSPSNQFSINPDYQLPQSCSDGQAPKQSGGSWTCGNFANASQSCSSGEFASGVGATGGLACGTPPGNGSHAYFATNSHVIEQCCGGYQRVVTLSGLPAGSYLAWVTVGDSNFTFSHDTDLWCNFKTGGGQFLDPVGSYFSVPEYVSDYGGAYTIAAAASLPSNGTLLLECATTYDDEGDTIAFGNITALKVDALN